MSYIGYRARKALIAMGIALLMFLLGFFTGFGSAIYKLAGDIVSK